jgi:hypothetical protein
MQAVLDTQLAALSSLPQSATHRVRAWPWAEARNLFQSLAFTGLAQLLIFPYLFHVSYNLDWYM